MRLKATCFMFLFSLYRSALTAAPLSSSSLNMFNVSDPFKGTLINHPLLARPQDPFEFSSDWDGQGSIDLTFSNYGADIPRAQALQCSAFAYRDAQDHNPTSWNQVIGKSELVYTDTNEHHVILLSVLPKAAMTWHMLFWALWGVNRFIYRQGPFAFEYEIEVPGVQGVVATGNLTIFGKVGS